MCDFEIVPAKRADGNFTCSWCASNWQQRLLKTSKKRDWLNDIKKEKYFATLAELYADHCFVPLLAWCKKNLKLRNMIVYCGEPEDPHAAKIRPSTDVLKFTEPNRVLPLVLPKVGRRKGLKGLLQL